VEVAVELAVVPPVPVAPPCPPALEVEAVEVLADEDPPAPDVEVDVPPPFDCEQLTARAPAAKSAVTGNANHLGS
jgi:hypothetical protein